MVNGLNSFREFFGEYKESFVILGGTACDEWFTEANFRFRGTKDIDLVILLEARNEAFFARLWEYLKLGEYQSWQRSDGKKSFYRFINPQDKTFPLMIELLARPEITISTPTGQRIVPIHVNDEISSLSAILLDNAYYSLILEHQLLSKSGLPLVAPEALILLKAKAYLNLLAEKNAGTFVKGDDLKKHRNDIFRLTYLLQQDQTMTLTGQLQDDFSEFLNLFPPDNADWVSIQAALRQSGLPEIDADTIISLLNRYYEL